MTLRTDLPTSADAPSDPIRAIAAISDRLDCPVARPGDDAYALSAPWNLAVASEPAAVVAVRSADDVAATVRLAGEHGLRVAVRRTGHGAVAIDNGDVLLIHTAALDTVEIDPVRRTARIGAGAIWQDVLDAAAPHGLAPITGSSLTVGVVGFLTGGGIGPFSRSHGLSSDLVRSMQVVTGRGAVLRVTADEHPELFWGLRGGKGTLGIVTEVEIDLVELETFYGGALYFDGADAPAAFETWRVWAENLPEHANTSIAILQLPPLPHLPAPIAGRMSVAVRYSSVAAADSAEHVLAPMRAAAEVVLDDVGVKPLSAIASIHNDPTDPVPGHEHSTLLTGLPAEAAARLVCMTGAGSGSPQVVVELRRLGGALSRPAAHPSAYGHRDAQFNLAVIGMLAPPIADAVIGHAEAVISAMEPWSTGRSLPNFTSTADPSRIARCYTPDDRQWLAALADQHDPRGVLDVGQVVRAAAVASA